MTIRELCAKEVVQMEKGVCLGRADDLVFDPATARLQSLILLGRPKLFGLLGRDEDLVIPGDRDHRRGCRAGAHGSARAAACAKAGLVAEAAGKAASVKFLRLQGWTFSEK